jgi:general stress protein 26
MCSWSLSRLVVCWLAVSLLAPAPAGAAQDPPPPPPPNREGLLVAAREIMEAQTYCALITIAEDGRPQVRAMNPFVPEADMSVWFATNTRSLKVRQIRADPRVTLYYANHESAIGYVALTGRAVLVDDMQEIQKRKRAYWDRSFPGLKNLVLIQVVPERIEVINYKRGAVGDKETWRPPTITFPAASASSR